MGGGVGGGVRGSEERGGKRGEERGVERGICRNGGQAGGADRGVGANRGPVMTRIRKPSRRAGAMAVILDALTLSAWCAAIWVGLVIEWGAS